MKKVKRYIHENGLSRKVNCIIPFCRKKFASKLELFVCKFNVTPSKYSPIYYCGSIGEALVDFYTLKSYRYKEPVEIVSMEYFDKLDNGKVFTINEFSNWLLSKADTANGRILANLINHNYASACEPKFVDKLSRKEAEKIVKEALYPWMEILALPDEYAHYPIAYRKIESFDNKDFYYVTACLYSFTGQKYPFLNEICQLIDEDYETIEPVDLDTHIDKLNAIIQESGIQINKNPFDSIQHLTTD